MVIRMNGNMLAEKLLGQLASNENDLYEATGRQTKLAVISVGDDPASKKYVRSKQRAAERIGMEFLHIQKPENVMYQTLISSINTLNADKTVDGIILQLPLPDRLKKWETRIINAIDPRKDVDGLTAANQGHMCLNENGFRPCTPLGIMSILQEYNIPIKGENVCIIGKSKLVGMPLAIIMEHEGATVSLCNSKTDDLTKYTKNADIVVVAVGHPDLLTKDMIQDGTVVIDVGINEVDGTLVGDCCSDILEHNNLMYTPVPGGVGPMTVASLISNTITGRLNNVRLLSALRR